MFKRKFKKFKISCKTKCSWGNRPIINARMLAKALEKYFKEFINEEI